MKADALALLDVEGGERFVLTDEHHDLVPATHLPWEHVARALTDLGFFMRAVAGERRLSRAEAELLRRSWALREGLVVGDDLTRLLWLVKTFRAEIEYDLLARLGADLGALWRERRWRLLLNLIDRLPRATWTHQAMANHPEYAERAAAAIAARRAKEDAEEWSPPLVESSPEVMATYSLIDAVNALRATLIMANSKPGAQPPKIPPHPRPTSLVTTMLEKAQRQARWSAHEKLAARVLPGRQQQT